MVQVASESEMTVTDFEDILMEEMSVEDVELIEVIKPLLRKTPKTAPMMKVYDYLQAEQGLRSEYIQEEYDNA